jgi:hypothetical protein
MRLLVVAVITLVTWSIIGFAGDESGSNPMNQKQIEKELAKELPAGSSKSAVVEYLTRHHIENSSGASPPRPDEILAIYRNVKGSTHVVARSVQVVFRFKDDRLTSFSVEEKLTGP